ncbi:MAG: efflux RND transporter permease subunit [Clostridium sp.]
MGGVSRYNGQETISISVTKQQSSTAMKLVLRCAEDRSKAWRQHDDGPHIESTVQEMTRTASRISFKDVAQTMVLAVVISMIIIWLFFGDIKASLIVGSSIPTSILVSLILMTRVGFTLNVITMSALVLGVGMMVDNSIVVLESCFRAMDKMDGQGFVGYAKASLEGTNTCGAMSIFGSTVTTCVVFIPLVFLNGMSGQMFSTTGLHHRILYVCVSCFPRSPLFRCTICCISRRSGAAAPLSGPMKLPAGRIPEDHSDGTFKT